MVVHNLNITGIALSPHKTNPPPIVNSNAVLPLSISTQGFTSGFLAEWQIFQRFRAMEQQQLSSGDPLKCPKARHLFIGEQRLGRL
jgi:hypothetical protein